MYEDILGLTYQEVREKFPDMKEASNVAKVVTFNNDGNISAYTSDSNVLVFYDVITGEPLTLVERIDKVNVSMATINVAVETFNSQNENYVASLCDTGEYIDITVVHKNLTICQS